MSIKKIVLTLLFLSLSLSASGINWAKDFDSGIATAKELNKPVLFVFSRHSCRYCVMLDETTLKDKNVIEKINKDFVAIISYTDEGDYTPRELWRPATPTLWFLDSNGVPMFQPLAGAMKAQSLLKALDIVKEEYNKLSGK